LIKNWWVFHPITVFTGTLVSIGSALFIFIVSYLEVNNSLVNFVQKHRLDSSQLQETNTLVIILLLSILVSATLFGVAIIFIYYQKLIGLYKFQQNFINGFTHELKTPIASLKLYIDTFLKYDLSQEEKKKYLEYMQQDTERLTLNVNQVLHLGKIEDKKLKVNLSLFEIKNYMKDFLQNHPHYFKDIKLKLNEDSKNEVYCELDPELFEMVVMNIITNAIHHTQTDKGELSISFAIKDKNIEIHFKDNGVGIAPSEQKNVFKKMYQIGKNSKGSGIGLYLATNIMRLHKGKLKVESKGIGHGANFIISLPIVRESDS
tara:strand:+ start:9325 stop:10278 length:954 start_codon:yes stop_codon:yes gene_type:complete